jgi:dihydroneopterin aldolase
MDALHITGLRAYGYTGALTEENTLGQWFEVDLTLWLDLSVAGRSDQLSDTHNYAGLIQQTQQLIETQPFKLIETLAEHIAAQALASDERIQRIQVQVTKPAAPIPHFSGQVSVSITRPSASGTAN